MSNYANTCKEQSTFEVLLTRLPNISGQLFAHVLTAGHTVLVWGERRRQRAALAKLPAYLQKDIGLTDVQMNEEAGKPFWVE